MVGARERLKETAHVLGKDGTSKNASLMKMKSIKEGRDMEEKREMAPSGTVERKPSVSSHVSSVLAQGEVLFP
jgi:hypothetical protein